MTEQQAQEAVRPLAPTVHRVPAEKPELTNAQKETLERLSLTHDEVGPCDVNPDGTLLVRVTDYGDEGRTLHDFVVYRDGVPF